MVTFLMAVVVGLLRICGEWAVCEVKWFYSLGLRGCESDCWFGLISLL